MSDFVADIEIRDVDGSTVLIEIATEAGKVQVLAEYERIDGVWCSSKLTSRVSVEALSVAAASTP